MNIIDINDFRNHKMDQKDYLMYIRFIDSNDDRYEDDDLQRFIDAVDDINESIDISDDDLINDCVLHLTRLIRDTKNKDKFNNYKDINILKSILTQLLIFDFNTALSKSVLEMVAFLSSTKLLERTEIMQEDPFFQYIADSATISKNPNSFIILSNFILENEENAKKCFFFFPPQFILDTFHKNVGADFYFSFDYNKVDFKSQKEVYLFSVLSLLSSYCNYNFDEEATLDIFICIKDLIIFNEENIIFLNELFRSLSILRLKCANYIQIANKVNIFECFEKIRCKSIPEIMVTIFQYYGDSILNHYEVPELNISKLINYISSDEVVVSGAALWLIWTILDDIKNIQCDLFQSFYNPHFFDLIQSLISLNSFVANVKLSLLIVSLLIEKATSDQISFCVTDKLINCIFDCNYIESDDQDVVFHIILALNRLLDHFCPFGKNDFTDFLKSHLMDITLCEFSEENLQILTTNCSRIMEYFG